MVLSSALIKTLTGNDTVSASFKYENIFEFRMVGKIFVNTNHLPQVTDPSVFTSDRIKVIPFLRHFNESERDISLKGLFTERNNLSAVLNWCLEGLRMYLDEGLTIPDSVRDATSKYQHDSDKISRFIEERLEPSYGVRTRASEVFEAYQKFCYANGFKESSSRTFNGDLESHDIEISRQRPSDGGSPTTVIIGYRLKKTDYQQVDIDIPFD
jgi:putative DNA primase/helicase